MYAIIETGGKQYRVQEGDVIKVEKLDFSPEDKVEFDKVLVLSDGKTVQVGTPYVDAVKVYGTVVENGKNEKVIIFKYKAKKDYRKKQGHRQPYTMVEIDSLNGQPSPKKAAPKKEAEPALAVEEVAEVKEPAEKKPAAKKAANAKPKAEKKPAAKKTTKTDKTKEV